MNLNITPEQLRQAADIQEKIQTLQSELAALLGSASEPATKQPKKRRMSRAGRAAIAAATRARWARLKGKGPGRTSHKPKRRVSLAVRARLAAIARERWRKVKAAGKRTL